MRLVSPERRVAYVWWCGDESCNCTQAVVEDVRPNPRHPCYVIREHVAAGPFYIDGEGDIDGRVNLDADYLAFIYGADPKATS